MVPDQRLAKKIVVVCKKVKGDDMGYKDGKLVVMVVVVMVYMDA